MRKILALGCCALIMAFGVVATTAHVHESGDHHAESRGLHLDHGHLVRSAGHDHHHGHHGDRHHSTDHEHEASGDHGHDGFYLNGAARSVDSNVRPVAAIVAFGATIAPDSATVGRSVSRVVQPPDPPGKTTTRLRAPPV